MKPFVYSPPKIPLDILYIDKDVLVVNKPSGLLSVPGKELKHRDSLELRVKAQYPNSFLVHRLDMDTSGIMIFALNKNTQRLLNMQFEKRIVKKLYEARVFGNMKARKGSINLPLIVDWPKRPMQKVDIENGKNALTHWKVLKKEKNVTIVELIPETGRTHQLRVHMKSLGHTILGGRFYGNAEEIRSTDKLQLHAKKLIIQHPKSGKPQKFISEVPF